MAIIKTVIAALVESFNLIALSVGMKTLFAYHRNPTYFHFLYQANINEGMIGLLSKLLLQPLLTRCKQSLSPFSAQTNKVIWSTTPQI